MLHQLGGTPEVTPIDGDAGGGRRRGRRRRPAAVLFRDVGVARGGRRVLQFHEAALGHRHQGAQQRPVRMELAIRFTFSSLLAPISQDGPTRLTSPSVWTPKLERHWLRPSGKTLPQG